MNIVDLRDVPEHLPTLATWHQQEWGYINPQRSLAERIAEMQTHLGDDLVPSTLVAENAGEVLGSASVIAHDMDVHQDKAPWLASVYVSPGARGKGFGSQLVSRVMQHAAAAGIPELYLYTMDQEALYQRLGWWTISREVYHGVDVIVMKTELSS